MVLKDGPPWNRKRLAQNKHFSLLSSSSTPPLTPLSISLALPPFLCLFLSFLFLGVNPLSLRRLETQFISSLLFLSTSSSTSFPSSDPTNRFSYSSLSSSLTFLLSPPCPPYVMLLTVFLFLFFLQ